MTNSSVLSPPPLPSEDKLKELLLKFGETGLALVNVGRDIEDAEERALFYKTELIRLAAAVKANDIYSEGGAPVSFREFCTSHDYLLPQGQECALYPKVMDEGEELNSGRYIEAVMTGGIGTGKTTLAVYTTAYQIYVLSCFRDPHKLFELSPNDEIVFAIQSLNAGLASDVDYKRLRNLIATAPYFKKHFMFERDLESTMQFPRNIIVKPVSGADTAIIGQNVIGGILDEVNFMAVVEKSKQKKSGGTYDQAAELYSAIKNRRQSRFMFQGRVPGMLCLVSSKQYPGEFTDRKMDEAKAEINKTGKTRIFIYDKREWDVKPMHRFTGEWFTVFLGDETRKPRIHPEGDPIPKEEAHLYMEVPAEYRDSFDTNILQAIREICGVSTFALYPFILEPEKVQACFGRTPSILTQSQCDFKTSTVKAYVKRFRDLQYPRFVHLDLSETGDSTGVACGYVPGFVEIKRSGSVYETLPKIVYDFTLEVSPPRHGEINFAAIRELLYNLRELGLPIRWVTMDTFQSTDMKQILINQGFMAGLFSLDVDTKGYDVAKQALMDERIYAPEHEKAMLEFIRLERDPVSRKVDHPVHFSKDCSDAMAGVAYGLTMRREVWSMHGVTPGQMTLTNAVTGQKKDSLANAG